MASSFSRGGWVAMAGGVVTTLATLTAGAVALMDARYTPTTAMIKHVTQHAEERKETNDALGLIRTEQRRQRLQALINEQVRIESERIKRGLSAIEIQRYQEVLIELENVKRGQ